MRREFQEVFLVKIEFSEKSPVAKNIYLRGIKSNSNILRPFSVRTREIPFPFGVLSSSSITHEEGSGFICGVVQNIFLAHELRILPIFTPSSSNNFSNSDHIPGIGFRYWSLDVAVKIWNGTSSNYVEGIFALEYADVQDTHSLSNEWYLLFPSLESSRFNSLIGYQNQRIASGINSKSTIRRQWEALPRLVQFL